MNFEATFTRPALLALGALATFSTAAIAQVAFVPDPVANDIFLGFRVAGEPNGYLLRLGNYDTYFKNLAEGTTVTLSGLGGVGADLTSEYGSDWSSNPNAHWSIFGSSLAAQAPLLFASRERSAPQTPSEPWPVLETTRRTLVGGNLQSVIISGYRLSQQTPNSTVATFQAPAGDDLKNYIYQTTPGIDFGAESGWSIEGGFTGGADSTVLDLYRVGSVSVLRVGFFTISSSGNISFTRQTTVTPPVDPNVDTDGDGATDAQEDLAGTSKTDPNDFFRVLDTTLVSGSASLTFKPAPNRTYKVFYSTDLQAGSWIEITSPSPLPPSTLARLVTGASPGTTASFTDPDPARTSLPKGFYRIEVSPNP